jgi:hypothetical protein
MTFKAFWKAKLVVPFGFAGRGLKRIYFYNGRMLQSEVNFYLFTNPF